MGTFFGAWIYPDQAGGWQVVHLSKINSWFLLGIISFVLVAELQRWQEKKSLLLNFPGFEMNKSSANDRLTSE